MEGGTRPKEHDEREGVDAQAQCLRGVMGLSYQDGPSNERGHESEEVQPSAQKGSSLGNR